MRKSIAVLLLVVVAFSIVYAVERKESAYRLQSGLAPVYINDGDTFSPFAVDCGSTSWSTIKTSRTTRRRVFIQAPVEISGGVCIGVATSTSTLCDASTPGVEFSTQTLRLTYLELFTESALTCRARADASTQTLRGFEAYDSGD